MPERPQDEVDRIVSAWGRERPDLDLEPLQVFSRVSRLARLLEIARRKAFAAQSLEGWEFDVLSALRRAGVVRVRAFTQLFSAAKCLAIPLSNVFILKSQPAQISYHICFHVLFPAFRI